jgi:hypothetical protein
MSIPTVVMSLSVENELSSILSMPDAKKILFEVDIQSLNTMIEGFGKIRDQLSRVV